VTVPRLWPRQFALRNRFYYYHEPDGFPSDIELDYPHSLKNIRRIAHKHIFPNLKLKAVVPLPDDVLVIHLMCGDIFETTKAIQDNYIQNPLSYYTGLIEKFERTIVVTEPGMKNPLVAILRDLGAVTIQSSTVEDDFSVLLSARNLASSGVGTFAVAAALCSQNIIRFFHSDVYGTGHLNPEMLHGIETYCIPLGENYIKPGEWIPNERTFEIMQNYQVDRAHFNNI
jgi:hypothetical protein